MHREKSTKALTTTTDAEVTTINVITISAKTGGSESRVVAASKNRSFGLKTTTNMKLQAKTKEQQEHVLRLLERDGRVSVIQYDEDGIYLDDYISFEQMSAIVDYLRQPEDKRKDLFEVCWVAYRRKGKKKQALYQWERLKDSEKELVLPHIKAYVQAREVRYQQDFERYLRDKVFNDVVYKGNTIVYDPSIGVSNEYRPQESLDLRYNEYYKCYLFTGMFFNYLADGYTDENRPDGATIKLNNARGTMVWSASEKKWNKEV